jgi:hypothetical protein
VRHGSETRHSPTDLDEPDEKPTPTRETLQFDYGYKGGATPWPERHKFSKVKFGPALVKKAWKSGLVVVAYVEGFPNPVAVTETRWNAANCFEVKCAEGWRLPLRIRTLTSTRGLQSTGEWIEPID